MDGASGKLTARKFLPHPSLRATIDIRCATVYIIGIDTGVIFFVIVSGVGGKGVESRIYSMGMQFLQVKFSYIR